MSRSTLVTILWFALGAEFVLGGTYLSWMVFHDIIFSFAILTGLLLVGVSFKALEERLHLENQQSELPR